MAVTAGLEGRPGLRLAVLPLGTFLRPRAVGPARGPEAAAAAILTGREHNASVGIYPRPIVPGLPQAKG